MTKNKRDVYQICYISNLVIYFLPKKQFKRQKKPIRNIFLWNENWIVLTDNRWQKIFLK